MHHSPPSLWNDDILREIFSHLAPTCSPPPASAPHEGRLALARCARSSKALFEPAVDFLWREPDSLSVVLRLLSLHPPSPGPAQDREEAGQHAPPSGSELAYARFRFYARRVRRLVQHNDLPAHSLAAPSATGAALAALRERSHGQPLFPKLAVLYWGQRSAHDVLDILTLVSPALRELHISQTAPSRQGSRPPSAGSGWAQSAVWCSLIHALSTAAPALETLTLSGAFDASSILCVAELKQLRTLTIVNLAQRGVSAGYLAILRSCAALSHLRDFGIKLAVGGAPGGPDDDDAAASALDDRSALPEVPCDEVGFHSLRSLRVHGSLSLVSRFLAHVASPALAHFDVLLPLPGRWEHVRACFDTLARRFASSLRTVSLSGSWRGDLASVACPMVVLGPLLQLPLLEELAVISHTGVARALAPPDVAAMAAAWPRLRALKLLYQPVGRPLPIDALAPLAARCPRLHTLWLASVDLRGAEARALEACPARADHALERIWLSGVVAGAPDASHRQAARFIDRMFPRVDPRPVVLPWHPCRDEPGWESVLACLREVKAARLAGTSAAP